MLHEGFVQSFNVRTVSILSRNCGSEPKFQCHFLSPNETWTSRSRQETAKRKKLPVSIGWGCLDTLSQGLLELDRCCPLPLLFFRAKRKHLLPMQLGREAVIRLKSEAAIALSASEISVVKISCCGYASLIINNSSRPTLNIVSVLQDYDGHYSCFIFHRI